MTTSAVRPRLDPRQIAPLVIAFGLGAGLAAVLDWYLWHPMSAIVTTLFLGLLGLVGAIAALVRHRWVRPIGLVLVAFAIGGFVGQAVGPSRPALIHTEGGSVRLVLTSGTTLDASGDASCAFAEDGTGQFQVAPGEFGVARAAEDADFHYVNVAIGDMSDFGDPNARPDHVSVTIRVIKAIVPQDGKPSEVEHTSDRASQVTLHSASADGGSLSFANLVVEEPGAATATGRSELAGTITWTCGRIPPEDGEDLQPPPEDAPPQETPPSSAP